MTKPLNVRVIKGDRLQYPTNDAELNAIKIAQKLWGPDSRFFVVSGEINVVTFLSPENTHDIPDASYDASKITYVSVENGKWLRAGKMSTVLVELNQDDDLPFSTRIRTDADFTDILTKLGATKDDIVYLGQTHSVNVYEINGEAAQIMRSCLDKDEHGLEMLKNARVIGKMITVETKALLDNTDTILSKFLNNEKMDSMGLILTSKHVNSLDDVAMKNQLMGLLGVMKVQA